MKPNNTETVPTDWQAVRDQAARDERENAKDREAITDKERFKWARTRRHTSSYDEFSPRVLGRY